MLPYVRSFSILEESQESFNQRVMLPDSYPALLINCGAPFVWEQDDGQEVELPRAIFVGVQTRPLKIRATGSCHVIGLNFFAWGTRFLIDERIDLSGSQVILLDYPWLDLARLLESTLHQRSDAEAVAILWQFMADTFRRTHIDVTLIRKVLEELYATGGQPNIKEIASRFYLSPSQLERRSKFLTGHSPKTLARLIRFDAACTALFNDSAHRLTDLALELGYVDQAHLIHEFKAIAACTPRAAKIYIQQLALDAEFLQFS